MSLPALSNLSFTRLSDRRVTLVDRHTPWCKEPTKEYQVVLCPHCLAEIHVSASGFYSQLPRRMHDHLMDCESNPSTVQPLRRPRDVRGRKPFGRSTTSQTQLYIDPRGDLARHELGSLLRCVAVSRCSIDSRPEQPTLGCD